MLVALIVCLALGSDVEPPSPAKILATVDWKAYAGAPDLAAGGHLVVRDGAELVKALPVLLIRSEDPETLRKRVEGEFAQLLKAKSIDWKKQMLVVVTGGQCPTTNYRVEVKGAKLKGRTLTVSWKLHAPKGAAGDAITFPATVALVPRHEGKVAFEQVK